jgi:hypothetical protein
MQDHFPRLSHGQNFIAHVPTLIDELAQRLSLPRETLDKSSDSLKRIDAFIKNKGEEWILESGVLAPLVAYVGEIIKQLINGEWQMRVLVDGKTWEPYIVDTRGKGYHPYYTIVDEFMEVGTPSMLGAIWLSLSLEQRRQYRSFLQGSDTPEGY